MYIFLTYVYVLYIIFIITFVIIAVVVCSTPPPQEEGRRLWSPPTALFLRRTPINGGLQGPLHVRANSSDPGCMGPHPPPKYEMGKKSEAG